jgi:hypothetical protein
MTARKNNNLTDAASDEEIVVLMSRDKDCKNSVRFASDNPALTNAYIGNDAMTALGDPGSIVITLSAA